MTDKASDPRIAFYRHNVDVLSRSLSQAARQATKGRRRRATLICLHPEHAHRARALGDLLGDTGWQCELLLSRDAVSPQHGPTESMTVRHVDAARFDAFYPTAFALSAGATQSLVLLVAPDLFGAILASSMSAFGGGRLIVDAGPDLPHPDPLSDPDDATLAAALAEPGGELAWRICSGWIHEIPFKTVANAGLQSHYGGLVLHDPPLCKPQPGAKHGKGSNADRDEALETLGLGVDQVALYYPVTGQTRAGLGVLVEQVKARPHPLPALILTGITDDEARAEADGLPVVIPRAGQPEATRLAIEAADALVTLQDTHQPRAGAHMPIGVIDAAARGLPIIARDSAALNDLITLGIVRRATDDTLATCIDEVLNEIGSGEAATYRATRRALFQAHAGRSVNAAKLASFLAEATSNTGALSGADHARFARQAMAAYGTARRGALVAPPVQSNGKTGIPGGPDIVMFWKQNDSGLYGRRPDMLMKHLLASGRVGRVLQFDAPIPVERLPRLAHRALAGPRQPEGRMVQNILDDQFGLRDSERHLFRTCLWSDNPARRNRVSDIALARENIPDFVARQMGEAGIRAENAIAWVCPVVAEFPEIAARIPFRAIVGDLIDDERTLAETPDLKQFKSEAYDRTMPLLDLALTNCDPMAEAFSAYGRPIHVVPNGAELPDLNTLRPDPEVARYPRPVAGYVGHLGQRIDWHLVIETAKLLPAVTFVLIGGGLREEDAGRLAGMENIRLHGAVPYERVQACIRAFDVALVPHRITDQTARMNPLKIYNYVAAARPVVSTSVQNLDPRLSRFLSVADDPDSFAAAISDSLERGPQERDPAFLAARQGMSWESRVEDIIELFERTGLPFHPEPG